MHSLLDQLFYSVHIIYFSFGINYVYDNPEKRRLFRLDFTCGSMSSFRFSDLLNTNFLLHRLMVCLAFFEIFICFSVAKLFLMGLLVSTTKCLRLHLPLELLRKAAFQNIRMSGGL